jgi:hypothetical protein
MLRPTVLGVPGGAIGLLSRLGLSLLALLALSLPLLGFCDLSLVVFQRTTDTFVEVNPRRRFVGKEMTLKRNRIRHHHARELLPWVQLARRP